MSHEWWLIIGMLLVTFLPRYIPILLAGKVAIPRLLERALEFVPIAVLSAIVAQSTLYRDGQLTLALSNMHIFAALTALIAAIIWRRLFITVFVGLVVYLLSRLLLN